jgi:hypothetical protein
VSFQYPECVFAACELLNCTCDVQLTATLHYCLNYSLGQKFWQTMHVTQNCHQDEYPSAYWPAACIYVCPTQPCPCNPKSAWNQVPARHGILTCCCQKQAGFCRPSQPKAAIVIRHVQKNSLAVSTQQCAPHVYPHSTPHHLTPTTANVPSSTGCQHDIPHPQPKTAATGLGQTTHSAVMQTRHQSDISSSAQQHPSGASAAAWCWCWCG